MKTILLGCLLTLPGCTIVSATSAAVTAYCAIPDPVRQANRILINASVTPNTVVITWAGWEGAVDD